MTRYKGDFPTATPQRKTLVARYYLLTDKYDSYCKLTNTTPEDVDALNNFRTLEDVVKHYEDLCKKHNLT